MSSNDSGNVQQREQWGSRIGFILAAAGSAIGLGNIWRFPYLVGKNGGAVFVVVYLAITVFIGLPIMMAEFSVGRAAQKAPVNAFRALRVNPFWSLIGWLATLAGGFFTLSFYNVVGGWTIKYMLASLDGLMEVATAGGSGDFFGSFIGHPYAVVFYQIFFSLLTMFIVLGGVGKGIERACKVMMPALFVIIIVLIARSVTLPGAMAGIEFYLKPDFSKLSGALFLDALGQSFFSLSLGLGIMLTYGSYLNKEERLPSACVWTASLDTLIAFLAGFAIFPAVFALGFEPASGAGLSFVTLPAVFAKMPAAGELFSLMFFLLLFLAAITSAMSLLEVATAFAMEKFHMDRFKAVWVMGIIIIAMGIPSAYSLSGPPKVYNMDFFDAMEYLCNNILLPVGSFMLSIFVGWFWLKPACKELTNDGVFPFSLMNTWIWCIRVIAPIAIAWIFITGTPIWSWIVASF